MLVRRMSTVILAALLTLPVWAEPRQGEGKPPSTGQDRPESATAKANSGDDPFATLGGWQPQPVTNPDEAGVRKFLKQAQQTDDPEQSARLASFPVLMVTTTSDGKVVSSMVERDDYVQMMTMPADAMEVARKMKAGTPRLSWITHEIVWVEQPYSFTQGERTWRWSNGLLLVREPAGWRVKVGTEGGWGDMAPEEGQGAEQAEGRPAAGQDRSEARPATPSR